MGCLTGIFVAEENDIQNVIGKFVYFGEKLGKHSEICKTLQEDFEILTDNQNFIEKFQEYNCSTRVNPLHYL